jgi:2'-5' RNA ligase
MPVTEATLFRSHLGGGPPRYQVVERFGLTENV